MHPALFTGFLVQAEESLLGKQEGCVLLLCTPLPGRGPLVPHWHDGHGLLSSLLAPSFTPLGQASSPWLPEQQSVHALPCSHLPYSSRNGVQAPWPAYRASKQPSNHTCLCSPSHPPCHFKFSRSLHGLSFQLRMPPLVLPGRLAFFPQTPSWSLKFSLQSPQLSWALLIYVQETLAAGLVWGSG